jgi:hypothetical protein
MIEQLTFKFSYSGLRQTCDVCGGEIGKFKLFARCADEDPRDSAIVCKDCIKDPLQINWNIAQHIQEVKDLAAGQVRYLQRLSLRLGNLPTPEEWGAAYNSDEFAVCRPFEEDAARQIVNDD